MEIILERIKKRKAYTIGKLYVSSSSSPSEEGTCETCYFCDTLEPTWRDYNHGGRRIRDHSAIPEGRYAVLISYSSKCGRWLPILLGGPSFNRKWKDTRINSGNTILDTKGDILVGLHLNHCQVIDSNIWLHRLKKKIVEAKKEGEGVWLTITTEFNQ